MRKIDDSPRRFTRSVPLAVAGSLVTLAACGGPGTTDNRAPVARIDASVLGAVEPGHPVVLAGVVDDPDGDAVTLSWELGDGTTAGNEPEVQVSFDEPGVFRIVLQAHDEHGAAATPAVAVVEVGAGQADAEQENFALEFGGTGRDDVDRVKIPIDDPAGVRTYGADIGATDMTIEMWLKAAPGANSAAAVDCGAEDAWINGNVVLDRDRFGQGRKFGLSIAGGVVVFGLTGGDDTALSLCGTTRVDDGRWHHVAVTRSIDSGAVELFVDGRLDAASADGPTGDVTYPDRAQPQAACAGSQPCTNSDPFLVLGAEKHDVGPDYPSYAGLVDELRLSTVRRYEGSFSPPARRFDADPDTAALYNFDEGEGLVARDTSTGPGAPSDGFLQIGGAIGGPLWTSSDSPAGG